MSEYDAYFLSRRFGKLRARVLLLKQDRLSVLEQKLEALDREEPAPLFLGGRRYDKNAERQTILSEIEDRLADYGNKSEQDLSDCD